MGRGLVPTSPDLGPKSFGAYTEALTGEPQEPDEEASGASMSDILAGRTEPPKPLRPNSEFSRARALRRWDGKSLKEERQDGREGAAERKMAFVRELRGMPVAINTADANEQHYEVPAEYFLKCLGPRLKYSSCLYPEGSSWSSTPLEAAEDAMLELYCKRAELVDGQSFLELGCGWGSLCLFLAERFPRSSVVAVSNSHSQR